MNLEKRAMLWNTTIYLPLLGERKDNVATATVENAHSVAHKRTKATKYLINRNAKSVKAVISAAQNLRAIVYEHSFAWLESKLRLSTTAVYPAFKVKWDAGVKRLDNSVENYFMDYPALCAQAAHDLGELYDASQYPPIKQLRREYRVSLELWPLPQTGHFVADIAQEAANEAKASMERRMAEIIGASTNDMIDRAEKIVLHFVEKLETFGKDDRGKAIGIFRDTLVTNIADQAGLLHKLNFANDSGIDTLATQLERLAHVTGEQLRDNESIRHAKKDEAKSMLAKLDAFRKTDSEVAKLIGSIADYY